MNKKGFTLVEVLVSLALVSTIAIFLFQIIFIIRDIYAEKNIKSEIYIESSNLSNVINKAIFNKNKNNIYIKAINKISNDEMYITYSDGTKTNILIDRDNHTITYGNYTVSILDVAKIGNIELYYNYEITDTEKNGICYIKIPITHDDYKNDFGVVITFRYNSSKTRINGEVTIIPGSDDDPTIPKEICSDAALNDEWTFEYTGGVQSFSVPCSGTYKLEVWGAQGGNYNAVGGQGGYSIGYASLNKSETIYVVVGGAGSTVSSTKAAAAGGYNGGGYGYCYGDSGNYGGGGGGATHMAKVTGELKDIGYNSFVTQKNGLIVAGGGGGNGGWNNYETYGGAGGGTNGTAGRGLYNGTQYSGASGATSTSGNAFGVGGNGTDQNQGGGGGGLYGGRSGANGQAGGGGSGYIGFLLNANSITGNSSLPTHDGTSTMTGNTGNGYAKITFHKLGKNVITSVSETSE